MATFFMFGKYTAEGIKGMSAARTVKANNLIKENGGKVLYQYAILGKNDLIFAVDFPGVDEVIKTSVALYKLTGISFSSVPAISLEQFDRLTT